MGSNSAIFIYNGVESLKKRTCSKSSNLFYFWKGLSVCIKGRVGVGRGGECKSLPNSEWIMLYHIIFDSSVI